MKTQTIIALKFLLIMTVLTGVIYPFFMTGVAQLTFRAKANGSLIIKDGKIIGSELIGQKFDSTIYFWSRPSAIDYNPIPSGASNLGPTSDKLKKQVVERRILFAIMNTITDTTAIPKEMIFASASGLDPHISQKAALLQVDRVAKARNFNTIQKHNLVQSVKNLTEKPQFLVLGEERVNVLALNLELNKLDQNITNNK
ncbi:MAG: potassium-transporting ATPase subunit KdpC [Bacteroidia bacterium]|nr:potassium-transporting ATPase subunit KdpC [Bacteroidia bacterium]